MFDRIINWFRPKKIAPKRRAVINREVLDSISAEAAHKFGLKPNKATQILNLCPICHHKITIVGTTELGNLIGSCGDAFAPRSKLSYHEAL